MKKNILFTIIGLIVGSTITAGAAYVYTASDIGYQPNDENWNVSNASEALSSLKEDLNNVNTNVTEYKQQITEVLADKGVSVDETSTMEEIQEGITNMSNKPVLIGQYSGNQTIDVSEYLKPNDTVDNFIIEMISASSASASASCKDGYDSSGSGTASGFTVSKTINGTNLVISGAQQNVNGRASGWAGQRNGNTTQTITFKLYHV